MFNVNNTSRSQKRDNQSGRQVLKELNEINDYSQPTIQTQYNHDSRQYFMDQTINTSFGKEDSAQQPSPSKYRLRFYKGDENNQNINNKENYKNNYSNRPKSMISPLKKTKFYDPNVNDYEENNAGYQVFDSAKKKMQKQNKKNANNFKRLKNQKSEQNFVYKNITEGRVRDLENLEFAIRVKQGALVHQEENLDHLLQIQPEKESDIPSFVENLKSHNFKKIENSMLKQLEKRGQDLQNINNIQSSGDSFEKQLYDLIKYVSQSIQKFVFILQGMFSGFLLMYLIIIDTLQNDEEFFKFHSVNGQRLNQFIQIFAIISCVGANLYHSMAIKQKDIAKYQMKPLNYYETIVFKAKFGKYLYLILYILIIIQHKTVAIWADNVEQKVQETLQSYYDDISIFYWLLIAYFILSIIGWINQASNTISNITIFQSQSDDIDSDDSDNE